MRRVAVATSGPMPSPGIKVTLCLIDASIVSEGLRLVETTVPEEFPGKNTVTVQLTKSFAILVKLFASQASLRAEASKL
jgi:hypothetical protein